MRKVLLAGAATCAAAAPAALAAAPVSTANFWQNKAKTVTCGKRIGTKSFQLLCSAKGVPRPKHGGKTGDPFVVLRKTGKPQLVLLSQREFPPGNPKTLANDTVWSRSGIVCTLARQVKCTNADGHGFTIGDGKYRTS